MISKNLAQRLIVAAIAIPAILFMVFKGGDLFFYFLLLLVLIGSFEYFTGTGTRLFSPFAFLPLIITAGAAALFMRGYLNWAIWLIIACFVFIGILLAVRGDPVEALFKKLSYIVWGCLYLALLYPFVFMVRGEAVWMADAPGCWWVFLLLASLWVGDTAAMFFGSQCGKHKLAPTVSPNKTWEGFWGGFIGTLLVAVIFKLAWLTDTAFYHLAAIAIITAFFGQLGDLVESLWKRSIGIKDSSAIIPGHGGVLDRFDSLLFAAPAVYFYLKYVMGAPWLQNYLI